MLNRLVRLGANEYVFGVLVKLVVIAFGLVQTVAISRYLGPELKGVLAYDLSIIGIGSVIMSFGLFDAYGYFKRLHSSGISSGTSYVSVFMTNLWVIHALWLLVAICVLVMAMTFGIGGPSLAIYLLCIPLWSYSLNVGYVMLIESPNRRNAAFLAFGGLEVLIVVCILLLAPRLYFLGFGTAVLMEALRACYFTARGDYRAHLALFSWKHVCELIRFGFFPMVSVLLTTLNYRVDIVLLSNSVSVGAASVGVYSVGMALADKATTVADSMREVLASRLAAGRGAGEVARVMRMTFALTLLVGFLIVLLGSPFFDLLYGEAFDGAYWVTVVTLGGTVWMVFFKMIAQYNVLMKRQVVNASLLLVGVVVNVVLNLALIPLLGMWGSALATMVSYMFTAGLFMVHFARRTDIAFGDMVFLRREDWIGLRSLFGG